MLFAMRAERAGTFVRCQGGSVAIVFALAVSVLVGITGLAVDYARLTTSRTRLQNATDASLLAAVRTLGLTQNETQATETANVYFRQALAADSALASAALVNVTVDTRRQAVAGSGSASFEPSFMQVLGFRSIPLATPSRAEGGVGEMELSVMIDLSSSMTGRRFSDLRTTLAEFVDMMMRGNTGTGPVRMAFAPFASAVNPGTYFNAVSGAAGAAQCTRERWGAEQYTDAPPAVGAYFDVFVPEPNWPCLSTTIMPLESSKTTVLNKVNSLVLSEGTSGHMGTMWSWYLISPRWSTIWPASSAPKPYGQVPKIAILMTDGENFTNRLSSDAAADAYALQICTNMKAAGVTVYAVGFEVDVQRAVNLLKSCASSPDKHFFPSGGTQFSEAFRQIAQQLTQLRLTN
jgi:hypothetical protein